ncbi:hypothetical protein BU17DRAFT_60308 [Hysterangium stoloniferum]|nr:hypothetical protein BU17DRAFT_60308 [Hysterangium stoloniferum]
MAADVIFDPGMAFLVSYWPPPSPTAQHITTDHIILGGYSSVSPHSHCNVCVSVKDPKFCADMQENATYGGCRLTRTIAMYFGLAIYKVMKHLGERGLLRTEWDGQNMVSIFSFLLRDTVLFYFSEGHSVKLQWVVLVNFMYRALFPNRFIADAAVQSLVGAYSITVS